MLKINPMVPGDRSLPAIDYKYNSNKVLSFVTTEGSGIKKPDITYLSK